jgi:hypothetical protein
MNSLDTIKIASARPEESPRKLKPVRIKYGHSGTALSVRLKANLHTRLKEAQECLEDVSGKSFSHNILVRAALSMYLKTIKQMHPEELKRESYFLEQNFR